MGSAPRQFKYKGFISYSHDNRGEAKRLQKDLEGYAVPWELVGREQPTGTQRLGLFFLDREDLPAGSNLPEALKKKLSQSENLIVICSPKAASSPYVAAEVKEFKRIGRASRIFALIVAGKPHSEEDNCFPPALEFKVTADGRLSEQRDSEPAAADATVEGYNLAKVKIIAGLLDLDPNELQRREVVAERRRRQIWNSIAAVMTILAIVATSAAWLAIEKSSEALKHFEQAVLVTHGFAKKVVKLSDQLGLRSEGGRELLEEVKQTLTKLADSATQSPKLAQSAAEVELASAESYRRLGTTIEWEQSAKKAQKAFEDLLARYPNNPELMQGVSKASYQIGLALRDQGYIAEALVAFLRAQEIRSKLVLGDPNNKEWRRDLSATQYVVAGIRMRQGRLQQAIDLLHQALGLRVQLAADEPKNAERVLDVSVVLIELGETFVLAGDRDRALTHFMNAFKLREQLSARKDAQPRFTRYLGWSHTSLGRAHLDRGDLEAALAIQRRAVELHREFLSADPRNADLQTDLAWAQGTLAMIELANGKMDLAIRGFDAAVSRSIELHNSDMVSARRRRNLARWLFHRGHALRLEGQFEKARQDLASADELLTTIVYMDDSELQQRAELGSVYFEAGRVEGACGNHELADEFFRKARAAYARITTISSEVPTWNALLKELDALALPTKATLEKPIVEKTAATRK